MSLPFKVCPACNKGVGIELQTCPNCGHLFRQTFPSPPNSPGQNQPPYSPGYSAGPGPQGYSQPPNAPGFAAPGPTQAFYPPQMGQSLTNNPDPYLLNNIAQEYQDARKVCVLTFWLGFLLFPLWVVTYINYEKLQRCKEDVRRLGVDVIWWQTVYRCKNIL